MRRLSANASGCCRRIAIEGGVELAGVARTNPFERRPRDPTRTLRARRAGGRGARPAAELTTEIVIEGRFCRPPFMPHMAGDKKAQPLVADQH